ncbi:alpha/beta hydrolase [Dokdonia sp. Dokd-P16]|uniref:alpha/beta fold hydrolase n=1 Tax=Dokdonia sp. Dokd-P16 TaxID=2173169 RepID=UPI000D547F5C|nr:alpha/beta hydrolase [Dokdonia sp. Dokd-P16]AWH73428.1 alpha/beta hydrolase [Dokdonia sp. Dokd-P16]
MTINHKGATIFYTDQGKGTPVILLHGFLENHTMWDHFLSVLCEQYRIICIDLLGHGFSESVGYVHSMEEMAAAVAAVTNQLALKDITIIGHSMGGYVGIAFAKAYPEFISKICLLNSTPEADDEARKKLRSRANVMAKKQYEQLVRMSFINLFDKKASTNHTLEIKDALEQALNTPVQGYIAANSGMKDRPDSSEFWKTTAITTGMILGNSDLLIDAEIHEQSYKENTNFFSIIESGHMSHITNATETISNILYFLSASGSSSI